MPGVRLDAAAVFGPLAGRGRIGLAVSGGADSLALMLLAGDYAAANNVHHRFVVYSVDHALRPEAAGEVAFVRAEAARLGFSARALRWAGDKPATGISAAARTARYQLIGEAMRADGCDVLVTAHHLHDQAETVLMRLAHGSGPEGLRGMASEAEVEGVVVVRPLLDTDPADLRGLVQSRGLVPVADPSNLDPAYERVRWRAMLPVLSEMGLDPTRIARFARRMSDTDDALTHLTREALGMVKFSDDGDAEIARSQFATLPEAVAVRLVGQLLDQVAGGRRRHALGALERLTERMLAGTVRTTLHGCVVSAGTRTIRVRRETGRSGKQSRLREPATP